ncbi:PilZ domain-containing protein [Sphingobium sp. HBC34]|uniref:PilZ domain-containing protein n=1 Tax=Sphingobium cyanobacteriorum TaxID=3063954 RepID=A0ABT8ZHN2_9SPHN|nr:PilZ domain-containing protein [Sphingobium sp. HBC34]MDO7833529.1 PilZ domain-containing protein [Sphingobium sp. HBC34]
MTTDPLVAYFERRRHPRFVTAFEAELIEGAAGHRTVIVGDISSGGCLLEHPSGFSTGSRVRLRARGLDMEARVMWVRRDLCGLRFAKIVDPLMVMHDNAPVRPRLHDLVSGLGDRTTGKDNDVR